MNKYSVEVWFATSYDYRSVAQTADLAAALREARLYDSDSRGVRIVHPTGEHTVVKSEAPR